MSNEQLENDKYVKRAPNTINTNVYNYPYYYGTDYYSQLANSLYYANGSYPDGFNASYMSVYTTPLNDYSNPKDTSLLKRNEVNKQIIKQFQQPLHLTHVPPNLTDGMSSVEMHQIFRLPGPHCLRSAQCPC